MSRPYSFLRHLGRAVFFGAYRDSLPMAIFSAYFDASGTKRARILTVAGFVSRVNKWDRFNDEWSALLLAQHVPFMHMTDFVSNQGAFVSWKGQSTAQSDRRRKFVADLSNCIKRNTNKGFSSSVILSDYREVNAEFNLAECVGQPFTLCMRACLGGLKLWANKKDIRTEDVLVAIEHGDDDQGELKRQGHRDGFTIVSAAKQNVIAFQAGDVAAWKSRTVLQNAVYAPVKSEEDATNIMRSLCSDKGNRPKQRWL